MENVAKTKSKTKMQWIAAIEAFLLMGMVGANFGWISPFLGKLNRPDPPFQATKEQISWVASINSMSRFIAIIIGSLMANFFGTKTSLYVCGFYYVGAGVSLICANSIYLVIFNQFCCGLGMGTTFTVFPLYLGEVVNPSIRGTIFSFVTTGFMIGQLYGNLVGSHCDPWIFGAINLALTGINLVTFYFFPSTPYYFLNCNKHEEAEKALRFYNDGADVKEEFAKLEGFVKSSPRVSILESVKKIKDPVNLKTLFMINVVYSVVQLSGTYTISEYLEVIIMNGEIEIIVPATLVTIMTAIAIPASFVAVSIGDRFGRVTMLLSSCLIFCAAFITWGLSFHLLELAFSPSDIQWLVIASALVYRVNMTIGLTPIVPALISEVFAPNVKSVCACICNLTSTLCIFISIKNFQSMAEQMTFKYVFYFYAGLVLVVGIYTKLCIPETKGKSLQEIQEMFNKRTVKPKTVTEVYVNTICEQTISLRDVDGKL